MSSIAFVNADVWTMNETHERHEAVLVRDGLIHSVGPNETIARQADRLGIEVHDADGKTILPGFVDAHTHLELSACSNEYWLQVHCPPHSDIDSMKRSIRAQIEASDFDGWLVARSSFGYQHKVAEKRLLTRQELDEVCPDRPLAVAAGLHVVTLNTLAMQQLGLWDRTSTEQMIIHRDEHGQPTGVATEVWDLFPGFSRDETKQALRNGVPALATRFGVTSVASIAYHRFDGDVMQQLFDEGVPLRLRSYWHVPRVASLEEVIAEGIDSRLAIPGAGNGGAKIFVDGQHGDGLEEVFDDPKWTQDELNDFVSRAQNAGVQLFMHAVSPSAVRMVLTALEGLNVTGNPLRHRIEHGGDYLDLNDLERIKQTGVILVTTPQFISSTVDEAVDSAPLRSILDAGIPLVAATDTTGTVPEGASPLYNIACAIHRGLPGESPNQGESVTFEEGVRMFTSASAWAMFEESSRGQIQPGYFGDLVVVDRAVDSVTTSEGYFDLAVEQTVFNGTVVFDRR